MSRQINDLFKPKTGERLYRDVQNRYPNSPYRAGHMERNKSSVQKEPPTWARTGAGAPPPTWAQRGPAGRSQAAYQNYRQTARANAQTFTANQQARLKNRQPRPQQLQQQLQPLSLKSLRGSGLKSLPPSWQRSISN